ncbi:hypothetical protein HL42_6520 [Trichophyton rubrum]|nr:hypothetical protein HL42_6520 [Trichophyton rubrum]
MPHKILQGFDTIYPDKGPKLIEYIERYEIILSGAARATSRTFIKELRPSPPNRQGGGTRTQRSLDS